MAGLFDIHRAVQLVRALSEVTPEVKALVEEFGKLLSLRDQASLEEAIANARQRSDALHADIQATGG